MMEANRARETNDGTEDSELDLMGGENPARTALDNAEFALPEADERLEDPEAPLYLGTGEVTLEEAKLAHHKTGVFLDGLQNLDLSSPKVVIDGNKKSLHQQVTQGDAFSRTDDFEVRAAAHTSHTSSHHEESSAQHTETTLTTQHVIATTEAHSNLEGAVVFETPPTATEVVPTTERRSSLEASVVSEEQHINSEVVSTTQRRSSLEASVVSEEQRVNSEVSATSERRSSLEAVAVSEEQHVNSEVVSTTERRSSLEAALVSEEQHVDSEVVSTTERRSSLEAVAVSEEERVNSEVSATSERRSSLEAVAVSEEQRVNSEVSATSERRSSLEAVAVSEEQHVNSEVVSTTERRSSLEAVDVFEEQHVNSEVVSTTERRSSLEAVAVFEEQRVNSEVSATSEGRSSLEASVVSEEQHVNSEVVFTSERRSSLEASVVSEEQRVNSEVSATSERRSSLEAAVVSEEQHSDADVFTPERPSSLETAVVPEALDANSEVVATTERRSSLKAEDDAHTANDTPGIPGSHASSLHVRFDETAKEDGHKRAEATKSDIDAKFVKSQVSKKESWHVTAKHSLNAGWLKFSTGCKEFSDKCKHAFEDAFTGTKIQKSNASLKSGWKGFLGFCNTVIVKPVKTLWDWIVRGCLVALNFLVGVAKWVAEPFDSFFNYCGKCYNKCKTAISNAKRKPHLDDAANDDVELSRSPLSSSSDDHSIDVNVVINLTGVTPAALTAYNAVRERSDTSPLATPPATAIDNDAEVRERTSSRMSS